MMSGVDTTQKKRNNYKLLVDPELKKGHKKLYRLNGKDVPGFPPCGKPKDPRTQKTVLGIAGTSMDLRMPRFKFDKFWEGKPPERDVFVIGLNESVKGSLLKEVCTDIDQVHSIKFHRHPKTKTFLGAATVCFVKTGSGRKAVRELDGKIVGGCYLRAEMDDSGEHLNKYLEPVLKKCGMDKKPSKKDSGKDKDGVATNSTGKDVHKLQLGSDSEDFRTRGNSIAETINECSESETEAGQSNANASTASAASTPLTPTSSTLPKTDCPFLPPSISTKLYPFSSLHLMSAASSSAASNSTPSETSPSVGLGSPGFATPSSIDSGISVRTHGTTILSPTVSERSKSKKIIFNMPTTLPGCPQPPLPPPDVKAPPLPPQDVDIPPPLPPLPPDPKDKKNSSTGIENISSDEENEGDNTKNNNGFMSPVSVSPANPTNFKAQSGASSSTTDSSSRTFDPSLGLQTLLAGRNLVLASGSNAKSSSGGISITRTSSSGSPLESSVKMKNHRVGPTTPPPQQKLISSNYELEVEEISGDESPVMVCFEPLQVETISDDDDIMELGNGGGDDMDVCSDTENDQDNVIELNVPQTRVLSTASSGPAPMIGPHSLPNMPHPPFPPRPPHGFFPPGPHPPPGGPFPPIHPPPPHHPQRHPPQPPPNFMSSPRQMLLPPGTGNSSPGPPGVGGPRDMMRRHYNSPPSRPFIKDYPVSRPPNGYISNVSRYPPSRSFSKSRMLKNFSSPKNKKDSISQDVLFKAMEQLRLILLNDVHKKIVESSAYPVLDSHWEKRTKEKQTQKPEHGPSSEAPISEKDTTDKSAEPYRRMLPGMKVEKSDVPPDQAKRKEDRRQEGEDEDDEDDEEVPALPTPRKRLMNFKIPLVNRGGGQRRDQQLSVVARRRLFGEQEEQKEDTAPVSKPHSTSRGGRSGYYSDISSSEDFSSGSEDEGEKSFEEEEVEEISGESSAQENSDSEDDFDKIFGSSESESDFETFVAKVKQKPPSRRESVMSDISQEETPPTKAKAKTAGNKLRGKKTSSKLKKLTKSEIHIDDDVRTSSMIVDDKENLSKDLIVVDDTEIVMKPTPIQAPKPRYKKRVAQDEEYIVEEFLEKGVDKEDVQMFKLALARLKGDGEELTLDVCWAHYPHVPVSALPRPPKRRRVMKTVEPEEDHVTGSARSEGYYKIDMRDKVKYLPHHRLKNSTTPAQQKKNKSSGRVNRANQRKLASLYSAGDMTSDLAKYNQLKARKKLLKFAKSTIHNWGLFAMESIAADEMVIEYVGQVVRQGVADEREKRYEAAGIGSSYLFRVDHDYIIDATKRGGLARFINHCCDPNCYAKVISFGTAKKIVIYSKRDIAMGEEITYDYKFPIEDEKIPCLCGAPNCRGTLN